MLISLFGPSRWQPTSTPPLGPSIWPASTPPRYGSLRSGVPVLQQRAILGDVVVVVTLDDDKTTKLFAWISRAFAGDQRYNNLMLACA